MKGKVPREIAKAAFDSASPESKKVLEKLTRDANRVDPIESLQIMAEKFIEISEGVDIIESVLMFSCPNRRIGLVVLKSLLDKHIKDNEELDLVKDIAGLYNKTRRDMDKANSN